MKTMVDKNPTKISKSLHNGFDTFEDSLFQLNDKPIVKILWFVDKGNSPADWDRHPRNNAKQIQWPPNHFLWNLDLGRLRLEVCSN